MVISWRRLVVMSIIPPMPAVASCGSHRCWPVRRATTTTPAKVSGAGSVMAPGPRFGPVCYRAAVFLLRVGRWGLACHVVRTRVGGRESGRGGSLPWKSDGPYLLVLLCSTGLLALLSLRRSLRLASPCACLSGSEVVSLWRSPLDRRSDRVFGSRCGPSVASPVDLDHLCTSSPVNLHSVRRCPSVIPPLCCCV